MEKAILPGMEAQVEEAAQVQSGPVDFDNLRFRRPDRSQSRMVPCVLDEIVAADHPVRVIWAVVEQMDLSAFAVGLKVQQGSAGRSAIDVRLLVGLWLWASAKGIGSARELERRCMEDDTFKWLCGGVAVNYHTLSDFRVDHESALDELLTKVLAALMSKKIVTLQRISQDGLKVRASAGAGSFRRRERLQERLDEARRHVEALKSQREAPAAAELSARQQAARQRAAREREARTREALWALSEVEKMRAASTGGHKSKQEPRGSTTDADARVMKMGDGGFRPAYNVQVAAEPQSRAIVGVSVTNSGSDKAQSEPMRQQVEQRAGAKVQEHLMDGGFVNIEQMERAAQAGVSVYAPPQQRKEGGDPYAPRVGDSEAIAAWRRRMESIEGKEIYKERASTSETVNADLRTCRGLGRFLVRGLRKVKCVALWSVLAYNLLHFGKAILMN